MATPAALGYTHDIYVSIRTDGFAGSGLESDPYDVSTAAKLDTFMRTTLPGVGPGCHVHFASGVYLTNGADQGGGVGFNLPGGNWYEGAGMWQTTIQAASYNSAGQGGQFCTLATVDNKNTRITGFTFDANWPTLKAGQPTTANVPSVEIDGTTGCEVDHCRFINNYGNFAHGQECFICKIASPTVSSVVQPCTDNSIHDCMWDLFQGDYGGGALIWNLQANEYENPSNNAVYDNVFNNHNHLQLSGATGGTCYCVGALLGQGNFIRSNRAYNCDQFFYGEGGQSGTLIKGNISLGTLIDGLSFNSGTNNIPDLDMIYEDNYIEMSNVILGANYNNNVRTGVNLQIGSATPNGNYICKNNKVVLRSAGYTTATRAHSGTTATIIFSAAPGPGGVGFNNGDTVDTSNFGDARYNVGSVQLTRSSATTYTYQTPASFTETTIADTSGTVDLSLRGLTIGGSTGPVTANVAADGNRIDHRLYCGFNASYSIVWGLWKDNLTETGAPLMLIPSAFHSLPNVVTFASGNNATTNGSNLIAALAHAALLYPNSAVPSATNRVTIQVPVCNYTVTAGACVVPGNYVDLIGQGDRDDTIMTSSGKTLTINSGVTDLRLKHFTITTTDTSTIGGSDSSSTAALWLNGGGSQTSHVFEDMAFGGSGTNNSVRGGQVWAGTYQRCHFINGGWFGQGQGQINGIIESCDNRGAGADTNNIYLSAGSIMTGCNLFTRFDLYRNDGLVKNCHFAPSSGNTDACYTESANGSSGTGVFYQDQFIPHGTGKSVNANAAQTYAISHCDMPSAMDATITNSVTTPNNCVDTHINQ
jgi:hypothetical protein